MLVIELERIWGTVCTREAQKVLQSSSKVQMPPQYNEVALFLLGAQQWHCLYKRQVFYCFKRQDWVSSAFWEEEGGQIQYIVRGCDIADMLSRACLVLLGQLGQEIVSWHQDTPREIEGKKNSCCPSKCFRLWLVRFFRSILRFQWGPEFARYRIMKGSLLLYFVKQAYLIWKEKLEMLQTMKWKFKMTFQDRIALWRVYSLGIVLLLLGLTSATATSTSLCHWFRDQSKEISKCIWVYHHARSETLQSF